jgi:hypothetical protein
MDIPDLYQTTKKAIELKQNDLCSLSGDELVKKELVLDYYKSVLQILTQYIDLINHRVH